MLVVRRTIAVGPHNMLADVQQSRHHKMRAPIGGCLVSESSHHLCGADAHIGQIPKTAVGFELWTHGFEFHLSPLVHTLLVAIANNVL
jgi:hypothetical protein